MIEGDEFSKAFLSIWQGGHSADSGTEERAPGRTLRLNATNHSACCDARISTCAPNGIECRQFGGSSRTFRCQVSLLIPAATPPCDLILKWLHSANAMPSPIVFVVLWLARPCFTFEHPC
jgi:hypothetical protein